MGFLSFFKKKKSLINDNSFGKEAEFVVESRKKNIGLKSSLMEYAALKKGLEVARASRLLIFVKTKKGMKIPFFQMNGIHSSFVGRDMCNRKQITRKLLKDQGLNVVDSKVFSKKQYQEALKFAYQIGFPVVLKPTTLSRGRGVTTNIKDENEFYNAWRDAISAYRKSRKTKDVLVEKHFNGFDYRVFVIEDRVISVTLRKQANVIGDGTSTVLELIQQKNKERKLNPYLKAYPIPEDKSKLDLLVRQNLKLDYVPKKNEDVILRSASNISAGGDSIDVTDKMHKDFKKLAIRAINSVPGISYAGVDFIAQDITKRPNNTNYIVSEIEFSPAPLAQFPYKGESRDLAGAILDYYLKVYNKN